MTRAALLAGGLALAAAFAVGAVLVVTAEGVGLTPDSASYVGAARELVDNGRMWDPVSGGAFTAWPPLYPAVLAALSRLGPSVEGAALGLNLAAVAATVALAAVAARRAGAGPVAAFGAAAVVATATATPLNAAFVQTETLYTLLLLAATTLAAEHLRRPRPGLLVATAVVLAAAVLTRYLGVAAVGAAAVAFALRRRWADAAVVPGAALVPLAAWMAWTASAGLRGTPAGRVVAWHPPTAGELRDGVDAVARWWLPGAVPQPARLVLTAALAVAIVAAARVAARRAGGLDPIVTVAGLVVVLYPVALLTSKSLLDALTPLDTRLLSPLLPVLAAAVATIASRLPARLPVAVAAGAALVVAGAAARTVGWAADQRGDAMGYGSHLWDVSPTMDVIRALPEGVAVYTNDRPAVYLQTGRTVEPVPHEVDPFTRHENPDLAAQVAEIGAAVRAGEAVVVWFTEDFPYVLPEDRLAARAGIGPGVELFDSTVYGAQALVGRPA